MVAIVESYLQFLETKATNIALQRQIIIMSFKRYVDDSHCRFDDLDSAEKFKSILNQQDERIQYTMETENNEKTQFREVKVRNSGKGK